MYCVTLVIYKHCDDASTDNDQDLFPFLYFYVWKCIETTSYIQKKGFQTRSQWVQILYKLSQAVFHSKDLPTVNALGQYVLSDPYVVVYSVSPGTHRVALRSPGPKHGANRR